MRFLPERSATFLAYVILFYRLIIFVKKKLFMNSFIQISSASGYFFLLRLGSEHPLQHRLLKLLLHLFTFQWYTLSLIV